MGSLSCRCTNYPTADPETVRRRCIATTPGGRLDRAVRETKPRRQAVRSAVQDRQSVDALDVLHLLLVLEVMERFAPARPIRRGQTRD